MIDFLRRLFRASQGIWHTRTQTRKKALNYAVIGLSTGGREIEVVRFGNGPDMHLYVGAIHGNEVGTVALMQALAEKLQSQGVPSRRTIAIIPCLNPDGYALARKHPDYFRGGRAGRYNGNGVDLNRNFPVPSWQGKSQWSSGTRYEDKEEVFCGESPWSEGETQLLVKYLKEYGVSRLVMFHSVASDITPGASEKSQELADKYARRSGFRVFWHDAWQTLWQTGTAKEYCDMNGIDFLEVEGSVRWGSDWSRQERALMELVES